MAYASFKEFDDMHLSVLQELGNMGSGGAATALATMMNTATDISVPTVRKIGKQDAVRLIAALCAGSHPLLIKLGGDFGGYILHLLPYPYMERIVQTYFPDVPVKSAADINEMTESVINETVNITSAAYANSLAELSGMCVDISTPNRVTDSGAEIFSIYPPAEDTVFFVNNSIIIKDANVTGNMVYFPELSSVCEMMNRIGVPC